MSSAEVTAQLARAEVQACALEGQLANATTRMQARAPAPPHPAPTCTDAVHVLDAAEA